MMQIEKRLLSVVFIAFSLYLITACGGGGSGSSAGNSPQGSTLTVDAGADQNANEGSELRLFGQGTDPQGSTITYQWRQVSGPEVVFANSTDSNTTVTLPEVAIRNTTPAVLSLTARNTSGQNATDQLSINITSTDSIIFYANKSSADLFEVYKFDPETNTETNLSGLGSDRAIRGAILSPDSRWVAFAADRDTRGLFELYVVSIDTGVIAKVNAPLPAFGDVSMLSWSPNSEEIAYLADAEQDDIGEVYVVGRDGSNHRKISGPVGDPAVAQLRLLSSETWSPDGRYIAQTVLNLETPPAVIGINTHDTQNPNSVRVTPSVVAGGMLTSFPRWLPDSSRLIYFGNFLSEDTYQLDTVRPDGSDRVTLTTNSPPSLAGVYRRSPDSSTIAYKADEDTTGLMELYAISPDGNNKHKLSGPIVAGGEVSGFMIWSPDSNYIAYTAKQEVRVNELFTSSKDGITNTKIGAAPSGGGFTSSNFSWSFDSARLAYSNRFLPLSDLILDLSTIRPEGSDNIQVVGNMDGIGGPTNFKWAADNSKLAFVSKLNDISEVYVASLSSNNNIKVNGALVANGSVDNNQFEWSSDSSHIAYLATQDDENVTELYLSDANGISNEKISGALFTGGNVIAFSWIK